MNRQQRRSNKVKQRYVMVNLIYASPQIGMIYVNLWLENQLKSLLDKTNLPALREKYELEYVLFTDDETMMHISRHPNFMALSALCQITIVKVSWPADADKFGARYGLLAEVLRQTMTAVFDLKDTKRKDAWLSVWVADLVFAKGSLKKILNKLEEGYDAVFNVPIRSAADSLGPLLGRLPGAPTDMELFEMAYGNLHHLWTHSTVNNPYFTRMPYSMVWNSGTGLLAHNYGVTPIAFKPNEEMLQVKGGIDSDLPLMCKKPYWATDWLDAAVAGVEPLSNGHYPTFTNKPIDLMEVAQWAVRGTQPGQENYLDKPLYYPSKKIFNDEVKSSDAMLKMGELQAATRKLREVQP